MATFIIGLVILLGGAAQRQRLLTGQIHGEACVRILHEAAADGVQLLVRQIVDPHGVAAGLRQIQELVDLAVRLRAFPLRDAVIPSDLLTVLHRVVEGDIQHTAAIGVFRSLLQNGAVQGGDSLDGGAVRGQKVAGLTVGD